jgi:hypothetical protein
MPKIGKYKSSFINAEDIAKPMIITITNVSEERVGNDDKLVMYFGESTEGIVLNKTCLNQLEEIFGSDDTDDWLDRTVVVYNDASVMFQGKKVGGIRFRKDNTANPVARVKPSDENPVPFE